MKYDIPDEFKPFVASVKRQCKAYGIELVMSPSRTVVLTDDFSQDCSGYFCDRDKAMVVACGRPFDQWIEIFIHEFCHMEQWKNDERWEKWTNATEKLWSWMSKELMLNKTQLRNVIDEMIELEKDCELRAVEKIKKWGLPISVQKYVQKANVYLYSYHMLPDIKRFPTGVHSDPVLVKMAPNTFKKSYRKIPKDIKEYIIRKYP